MSGVVGSGLLFGLHAAPLELGKLYSELEAINMALLTELAYPYLRYDSRNFMSDIYCNPLLSLRLDVRFQNS